MRTHNVLTNICDCNNGYFDNGVTRCKEICGDGLVLEDACDDGNTNNNDGCSSTCTV